MSISGKYLKATHNGSDISGTHSWTVNETADRIEATTGADGGRGKKDPGVVDTTVTIRFYLDINTGVFTAFRAGSTLTNLTLFSDLNAASPIYAFTSARVFGCRPNGAVRDKFEVEVDCEPYGNVITANNASNPA